mmetsp:Transcript_37947/g.94295  ORF Transcript_37947/g.94295 Transcript_37947/m.94295 type:complete len:251 (+) Transcript_37947:140-892(+)
MKQQAGAYLCFLCLRSELLQPSSGWSDQFACFACSSALCFSRHIFRCSKLSRTTLDFSTRRRKSLPRIETTSHLSDAQLTVFERCESATPSRRLISPNASPAEISAIVRLSFCTARAPEVRTYRWSTASPSRKTGWSRCSVCARVRLTIRMNPISFARKASISLPPEVRCSSLERASCSCGLTPKPASKSVLESLRISTGEAHRIDTERFAFPESREFSPKYSPACSRLSTSSVPSSLRRTTSTSPSSRQ